MAKETTGTGSGTKGGSTRPKTFGTFSGVFLPTLLTILGVIMYLRTGWVVGQVGLAGAFLVILLSFAITGCTGLSLSSVTTNIRIGTGGAYAMISQSLGVEIGGAVGVPLYLSQSLAVAMYVFGFREGWVWIFPGHSPLLVDLAAFGALFLIAYVSVGLAFRVQYFILALIVASLVSVGVAAAGGSMQQEVVWVASGQENGAFVGPHLWVVFAVFFPAATGIMAGANMSGVLKNPRRSIPRGTLSAIGLSLLVYVALAYWLARSAPMEELRENYTAMVDLAAWKPAVLAGLLGATFSSALSSLVGAPRILQALGQHRILPAGEWLSARTEKGEPRHALYLSAVIALAALMLRDLNAIAPLITMFFLITYGMINVVVFLEQRLGLVSFRPSLSVPHWVPLVGTVGCVFAMFIVNATFSLIALGVVGVMYIYLIRRHLEAPFGDVRSGVFVSLAEWAAKKVVSLPENQERAWKPNLLVPTEDPPELRGDFGLLRDLAAPRGSVRILGLHPEGSPSEEFGKRLNNLSLAFREDGVFASWSCMETAGFPVGVLAGIEALGGAFFKPNLVFLSLERETGANRGADLLPILSRAPENGMGVVLYAEHPRAWLGRRSAVNIWVPHAGPGWAVAMERGDLDLALLLAYKLKRNWNGELRLIAVAEEADQKAPARLYLMSLIELARLPDARPVALKGEPNELHEDAPEADVHFFVLPDDPGPDCSRLLEIRDRLAASCIFVRGTGNESAFA